MEKPRIRVPARMMTADSFQNVAANLGYGANNLTSTSHYALNPISRQHVRLEWMYRGSWLIRKVVDCVANDMTRAGIDIESEMAPDLIEKVHAEWNRLDMWGKLRQTIKWARLYGGCLAVIMIEGQPMDKPLRLETIAKDSFKGLLVLDRWMVTPDLQQTVREFGPDFGKPMYYETNTANDIEPMKVHYSRVIRLEGDDVPYWQRMTENGWTVSVVEQLFDRLIAFDSATTGAAQLVYKAHLRTYKVPGLRELIAAGGPMYQAFLEQMKMIRLMQSNEGLTVIDAEDAMEYHTNSAFSGLSDALTQFGQQLSGACDIPLVVLFGQSPSGFSTGDTDVRNYYDRISSQQKSTLEQPIRKLLRIVHYSMYGEDVPEGFNFSFNPLWQLSESERATIAQTVTGTVMSAHGGGLISDKVALAELKQSSHETGIFSNISDEDIEAANDQPPAPPIPGMPGDPNAPGLGHNGGPPLEEGAAGQSPGAAAVPEGAGQAAQPKVTGEDGGKPAPGSEAPEPAPTAAESPNSGVPAGLKPMALPAGVPPRLRINLDPSIRAKINRL